MSTPPSEPKTDEPTKKDSMTDKSMKFVKDYWIYETILLLIIIALLVWYFYFRQPSATTIVMPLI